MGFFTIFFASSLATIRAVSLEDLRYLDEDLLSGVHSPPGVGRASKIAVATLVSTNDYAPGAVALGASIHTTDPSMPLVAVVIAATGDTSGGVSPSMVTWIETSGWVIRAVPVGEAVKCAPTENPAMSRFQFGCAKLHLWSELSDYTQILYIDADSFARYPGFNARALLEAHKDVEFAAKPVPPDSQLCGGRHARVQLGLEKDDNEISVTFTTTSLGVALAPSPGDGGAELVVSGVRSPASDMGVVKGLVLVKLGSETVPRGFEAKSIAKILKEAPRPITLTFRRPSQDASAPVGDLVVGDAVRGAAAEALLTSARRAGHSDPSAAEFESSLDLLHPCEDLFNTNIMVLKPSSWTFTLMVLVLNHLIAAATSNPVDPGSTGHTVFDSSFLSKFFGHYWETGSGTRWLQFRKHMELTIAPVHWPFHAMVGEQAPMVAQSAALGNFIAWGELATVDFSGPPQLKPWNILAATQQRLESSTSDVMGAVWRVMDAQVPGSDGRTRRPFVDLIVTVWVQWLGAYTAGCNRAMATQQQRGEPIAPSLLHICEFHPAISEGTATRRALEVF